jgi:hypothetical protein
MTRMMMTRRMRKGTIMMRKLTESEDERAQPMMLVESDGKGSGKRSILTG